MLVKFVKTICNKAKRAAKGFVSAVKRCLQVESAVESCMPYVKCGVMGLALFVAATAPTFAQSAAGDYSAGTNALSTVADEIALYIPIVVQLCYAIAGVVAILGAISVYIAMNNEEQDVKKKIMMVVGACLFMIAAAQALPMFFGLG